MRKDMFGSVKKLLVSMLLAGALLLLAGCTPEKGMQSVKATTSPAATELPTPTATPEPTATPVPTALPTLPPLPEPTPCGLLSWRESGRFTEGEVEQGKNFYRSANISVTVETVSVNRSEYTNRSLTYYMADIYLKDVTSLRRGFAKGSFTAGSSRSIENMAKMYSNILVMSGDQTSRKINCLVIHDGELVFDSGEYTRDLCVLYRDGTIETYAPEDIDVEAILAKDPWQSWSFGPILLDKKGRAAKDFNLPDHISARNPRAVLGYYKPGHYCLIVVDGRRSGYSLGLNIHELAEFVEDFGFTAAYNLDGGLTAQIAFGGERLNRPVNDRSVRDVLYIVDSTESMEAQAAQGGE